MSFKFTTIAHFKRPAIERSNLPFSACFMCATSYFFDSLTNVRLHHSVVDAPYLSQVHAAVQKHCTSYRLKNVTQDLGGLESFCILFGYNYEGICSDLQIKWQSLRTKRGEEPMSLELPYAVYP